MLEMTQINYIKELREREGLSISEKAKRLKIHWNTTKKYSDGDVTIKEKATGKRERPVMGSYEHLVEAWLEEDLRMPKKQRRTAISYNSYLPNPPESKPGNRGRCGAGN